MTTCMERIMRNKIILASGCALALTMATGGVLQAGEKEDMEAMQKALNKQVIEGPSNPGNKAEMDVYRAQALKNGALQPHLEGKLRAPIDQEVGGPLSDVDTTLPKFAAIPRPSDVALVIGIEKYQKLVPAQYARADAEQVANYLRQLGYAPRNVEVLLNERATHTAVRLALEQWLPEHVRADSRVLVYYSGHGSINPATGETYLVPHDGDPSYLASTAYSTKMLYAKLGELKARQVVVTLDSCFSGQGGRSVMMEGARPAVAKIDDPALASSNLAVLAAAEGTQISASSKERRHGLLTYHFLKALQEGKQDLASIYEYVNPKVQDDAKLQNVAQSPSLRPGLERGRKFVLWDKQ